jgi:hypothetical protein
MLWQVLACNYEVAYLVRCGCRAEGNGTGAGASSSAEAGGGGSRQQVLLLALYQGAACTHQPRTS